MVILGNGVECHSSTECLEFTDDGRNQQEDEDHQQDCSEDCQTDPEGAENPPPGPGCNGSDTTQFESDEEKSKEGRQSSLLNHSP